MNEFMKRANARRITCWAMGLFSFVGIVTFQIIYLKPTIVDLLFTFVIFISAWSIRGIYQETKDTMLHRMGRIELSTLRALIDQVIGRKKDES